MSQLKYYSSDPNEEVIKRKYDNGLGCYPELTVYQAFSETVGRYSDKVALVAADGRKYTYREYMINCRKYAKSILKFNLSKDDSINIIGFNSPEYVISYLGTIFSGSRVSGVYSTNTPIACKQVIEISNAKILVCDGKRFLDKYLSIINEINIMAIVVFHMKKEDLPKIDSNILIFDWDSFLEYGNDITDEKLDEIISQQKPSDTCAYVMTSGTTGNSKAVMITQDNYAWTGLTCVMSLTGTFTIEEMRNYGVLRLVSYLPLSHVAAQMVDVFLQVVTYCEVWFARPDALKGTLRDTIVACQPTFQLGVPRVWEKMHDKLKEMINKKSGYKKSLANWALEKAELALNNRQYNSQQVEVGCYSVIEKVLINKVKESLGFMNLRVGVTSAAPISYEILKFLCLFDLPIYEVLGASEATGPGTSNNCRYWKVGTCGRCIEGGELKVVPETGEICFKGRHIFKGYKDAPDMTKLSIDDDGWYHTGDTGVIDEDGFLTVKGRIKELIITAGGENISPVFIEDQIKVLIPFVSQATLIGDKKKYLSILLTLKTTINEEGSPTIELSPQTLEITKSLGSLAKTIPEAINCKKIKEYIDSKIEIYNNEKAISNAQGIRKWCILERDYSVATGEMTPTMKMCRGKIMKLYEKQIEDLYKE